MKAEVKIPKGWRRLRRGTKIRQGDKVRWWLPSDSGWQGASCWGHSVGLTISGPHIYIRRKAKKARKQ